MSPLSIYRDRRSQQKPTLSYFTHWIVLLTFLIQLALGAIAYGRLDGRVTGIEDNVKVLLEHALKN